MPLTSGTRIGPYEVLSLLGTGGMGEVYRAHDTKLNRDVAIKVLPEEFAQDPERIARFHREVVRRDHHATRLADTPQRSALASLDALTHRQASAGSD